MGLAVSDALTKVETSGEARAFVQRFSVSYEFPVYFTRDVLAESSSVLLEAMNRVGRRRAAAASCFSSTRASSARCRICRSASPPTSPRNADKIELAGPVEIVEGGEQAKNAPELVERLQRLLVSCGVDRHSYVVAIGGGAVLDLIGYVAATTHRGIRHIRIPTTVLAQNDSGVGVKNGVNAFGFKNMLGTFVPPVAVINDSRLHRRAARPRQARRHGRGGQGRADPRRRLLRLARGEGGGAGALRLRAARAADPPLRAAAHAADLPRRRSVRARQRPAARLRPLGGAQAGSAVELRAAPRRGGRHRHRARHALLGACRAAAGGRDVRVRALLERLGFASGTSVRRARRRRPALLLAGSRSSASTSAASSPSRCCAASAPASTCTPWTTALHRAGDRVAAAAGAACNAARPARLAPPHLLHEHSCRRTLERHRGALSTHLPAVKRLVSPTRRWVSACGCRAPPRADLGEPRALAELRALPEAGRPLRLHINAFPYGSFHGTRVKEKVYEPDWRHEGRLHFTNHVANIMAELLPEGIEGSISTVPGAYKASVARRGGRRAHGRAPWCGTRRTCTPSRATPASSIVLALEPEPCCFLETTDEAIDFFEDHLLLAPRRSSTSAA